MSRVERAKRLMMGPYGAPLRLAHRATVRSELAAEQVGGLPVVMTGPQAYVARTDRLREVPYDENIRMVDHRDFFSSASGRLAFVSAPQLVAFHARTPFEAKYTSYRDDVAKDLAYLGRKWTGTPRG